MDKECAEGSQALENSENEKQAINLELSEVKERLDMLRNQNEQLSGQVDSSKSKFDEECEKTSYLRLELKNSKGELKILESRIKTLQEDLDTVRTEYASYQQRKEQETTTQNFEYKQRVVQQAILHTNFLNSKKIRLMSHRDFFFELADRAIGDLY